MADMEMPHVEIQNKGTLYRFGDDLAILMPNGTQIDPDSIRGILNEIFVRDDYLGHPFVGLVQPSSGEVILDIGGHVGCFSVLAAKRFPGTRVLVFEPLPENFELLLENLQLNHVTEQVSAFQSAVTQSCGHRDFYASNLNSGLNSLYPLGESTDARALKVETIGLNEFLDRHGLGDIFLLKMDCEGAEYEILYGADAELFRRLSLVVLEYHRIGDKAEHTPAAIQTFLEERGFLCDVSFYPGASMIYAIRADLLSEPVRKVLGAYRDLAGRAGREFNTVLQRKEDAFKCLHDDRTEAQRIMEAQAAELTGMRGAVEDLRRDRAEAQRIMDEQAAGLTEMREAMEDLRRDRAEAERVMDEQAAELAGMREAMEDLHRDRIEAQRIMNEQAAEAGRLRGALAGAKSDFVDAREGAEQMARVLAEIYATRGWRALVFFRRIRDRLSPDSPRLRARLRRSAGVLPEASGAAGPHGVGSVSRVLRGNVRGAAKKRRRR